MKRLARSLGLSLKAGAYLLMSAPFALPGRRIDGFGRRLGWRWRKLELLLHPVSSVRYFEFDFIDRHWPGKRAVRALDVSSPYLIGYYLCAKHPVEYHYINLDRREIEALQAHVPESGRAGSHRACLMDGRRLDFADESFDVAVSVSVLEHIPDMGDRTAVREIWRVLRPGGTLLLTVPVARQYREESRDTDAYRVGIPPRDGRYFFQRIYDRPSIEQRLTSRLAGCAVRATETWGERQAGFFEAYEHRWQQRGLSETVKDPYLMARHMRSYPDPDALPGIGVMAMCLEKAGG